MIAHRYCLKDRANLQMGEYEYTRPGWRGVHQPVKVLKIDGQLYIEFDEDYPPTSINNIPADAVFIRYE